MKSFYFIIILFLVSTNSFSQQERKCATHDLHLDLLEKDSEYKLNYQKIENEANSFFKQSKLLSTQANIITIPIVVHVIYRTAQENISNAQIQSQIDVLNEAFRALNSNLSNTLSQFSSIIGDMEIEFCLATVDPNGNPTTGITRKSTTVTEWGTNNSIKFASSGGVDAWPRGSYLNMWVGNIGNDSS